MLVATSVLIAMGYGIVSPALPALADDLGSGPVAVALVIAAFGGARILFAPLSGWLTRRGALPVFCAGLLVVGLSSAACAFAADYGQLLAFRTVGGLGSTMFTVSAAVLIIAIVAPAMRGRAMGAWSTGFLIGTAVGPVVGGALMTASIRAPFLGYLVLLLAAACLAYGSLRGRVTPAGAVDSEVNDVTFLVALRHPAFRAALGSNIVNGWTVYGVRIALVPLFAARLSGGSGMWVGIVLTGFAVGTAVALPVGGHLADRCGRRPPALLGSAVVAITTAVLGFATTGLILAVVAVLSGVGTGLMNPPVNAAVGDVVAGDGRRADGGPALAGFQMVGDAGAVVGPMLAGLVAQWWGYPAAFLTTAGIVAASFLGWLGARETLPPQACS